MNGGEPAAPRGAGDEGAAAQSAAIDRREGRGRLSSIDLLPDEAEPEVVWALEQLRDRKLPQTAILAEFNERLADKGIARALSAVPGFAAGLNIQAGRVVHPAVAASQGLPHA